MTSRRSAFLCGLPRLPGAITPPDETRALWTAMAGVVTVVIVMVFTCFR